MHKACYVLFFAAVVAADEGPMPSRLSTSPTATAPVRFGAETLRAALDSAPGFQKRVVLGQTGDSILDGIPRQAPGSGAESYSISVHGGIIAIEGRDAVGAMYGAFAAAEQLQSSGRIEGESKTPFLAIRGINTFLTAQGFDEADSWYWSDEFWTKFLDMMARNRYNFLDLHGPFDITVSFPNGFPYLVYLPDFPDVGVGRERAAKNLARFRQIIRMAADRGVNVGYMNYTAAASIGPWNTGRFWKDQRYAPRLQKYLPADRLESYTREAAATLLQQLPELWMFGFRIGESGQPEDFYQKTYIEAIKKSSPKLRIYARTWIADPARVREIATLTQREFFIEPKYNGEQLGLPYQAVTGGRYYPPSGSWEDYSSYPRNYSIIWQIRANGTHRVFHWGSPEFARRTARSCKFAGGLGFSMEPMNSYYPQTDYLHNNPNTKHNYASWIFEQQWFWYMVWGRMAYDPDTPDQVWLDEFKSRFGEAGDRLYRATVESSKIVPFLYSYHNQGLDHQHMAPEFETGDHSLFTRSTIWQGSRLVPYGGAYEEFLNTEPMDRTAMTSPMRFVELRLNGEVFGGTGPFEAAQYLTAAAAASEKQIEGLASRDPRRASELDCIRLDVKAVAALGRYYADRIISATHLEFYRRTFHHPELTAAWDHMKRAVDDWDVLSDVTDQHFGYVPELIRMRVYNFRWRDEGRSLGLDLEDINRLEDEFQKMPNRRAAVIGHVPPPKLRPGQPYTMLATQASAPFDARLHLFYRTSESAGYTLVPMRLLNAAERTWGVDLPPWTIRQGTFEYYFESYEGITGAYGGTLGSRKPYRVRVTNNDVAPVISHERPAPSHGDRIALTIHVSDVGAGASVLLHYKRMPSYHDWLTIQMKPAENGVYHAEAPLTPEGLLYYFTAENRDGNATNYPDFLKETPYFVVDSWSAGSTVR